MPQKDCSLLNTVSAKGALRYWHGAGPPLVTEWSSFPLGALMCLVQRVPDQSKKNEMDASVGCPGARHVGTLHMWSSTGR